MYVHIATIRPFLLTDEEKNKAPQGFKSVIPKGIKSEEQLNYTIGVSPLDCQDAETVQRYVQHLERRL